MTVSVWKSRQLLVNVVTGTFEISGTKNVSLSQTGLKICCVEGEPGVLSIVDEGDDAALS
jgi:hypothetical protein